jgi:hypothetical protein
LYQALHELEEECFDKSSSSYAKPLDHALRDKEQAFDVHPSSDSISCSELLSDEVFDAGSCGGARCLLDESVHTKTVLRGPLEDICLQLTTLLAAPCKIKITDVINCQHVQFGKFVFTVEFSLLVSLCVLNKQMKTSFLKKKIVTCTSYGYPKPYTVNAVITVVIIIIVVTISILVVVPISVIIVSSH